MKIDFYSDKWFLEEIKKTNILLSSNKIIDTDLVNKKIENYLKFEFRSPIEIANNDSFNEILTYMEKIPGCLNSSIREVQSKFYSDISLEECLDIFRHFKAYKNHLSITFLFIYQGDFKKFNLTAFSNFKNKYEIAQILDISIENYRLFCNFLCIENNF